ncbi:hypothetical protein [Streptomyces longisporoflavus]|uniref:Type I restriction modification DNA specificity domain-containing protein n=1 Tax=Streptomyces longisporoflavus TaxID=28044 RepID=A0ABW7QXJ5_9ACTN
MEAGGHQVHSGTAAWPTTSIEIERARRNIYTTCGFLDDDGAAGQAPGVVSSTFVRGGSILSPETHRHGLGGSPPTRATLREGDLAVVLVRRVGASALVTAEHAGWTATRSIGIIRAEPYIVRWLRIWLQTPTAKARIEEDVTAHVEPTISLDTLRRMLFPLPPPDVVTAYHRAFSLIEEMTSLYQATARKALELADALHEDWASTAAPSEIRLLAKVAKLKTGKGAERSLPPWSAEATVDVIAPKDLYDLHVPHVERFRLSGADIAGETQPAGTFMLSSRSEGAHIAVPCRPATPLRGVVAIRPTEDEDGWWLFHELRSRRRAVPQLAQGQSSREISARALKRLEVTWPDRFTRAAFHKQVDPLHTAARLLVSKIATLHALRDALFRDISAKAGVLREPTAEPGERSAGTASPAPRIRHNLYESGWDLESRR